VGATIIGRGILSIYGADFPQGYPILLILVAAALFQSYYLQLINTMDALDRPDLSFRVNLIFVVSNIILNFTLIHFFGWSGAAFATLLSTAVAMVISFRMLLDLLDFSIPRRQIGCQIFSAIVMGIIVQSFNWALSSIGIDTQGLISVLASVALGGVVYFFILLTVSNSFRITVSRNLPISELI
jgi:O-antigen/teichoic acid export membrane protein